MKVFIAKLNTELDVDFDSLPEKSKEYVIAYGLRQSLNDSVAPKEYKAGEKGTEARVLDRLDAILNGTVGVRSVGVPTDPIAAMAQTTVRELLRKKGIKRDKDNPDVYNQLVAKHAKNEKIMQLARELVAARDAITIEL